MMLRVARHRRRDAAGSSLDLRADARSRSLLPQHARHHVVEAGAVGGGVDG